MPIFTLCVAFALCTCFTPNNATNAIRNTKRCNCQQSICTAVTSRLWFFQLYLRELLILCGDLERVFSIILKRKKNVGHDKTRDFAIITRQKRITQKTTTPKKFNSFSWRYTSFNVDFGTISIVCRFIRSMIDSKMYIQDNIDKAISMFQLNKFFFYMV